MAAGLEGRATVGAVVVHQRGCHRHLQCSLGVVRSATARAAWRKIWCAVVGRPDIDLDPAAEPVDVGAEQRVVGVFSRGSTPGLRRGPFGRKPTRSAPPRSGARPAAARLPSVRRPARTRQQPRRSRLGARRGRRPARERGPRHRRGRPPRRRDARPAGRGRRHRWLRQALGGPAAAPGWWPPGTPSNAPVDAGPAPARRLCSAVLTSRPRPRRSRRRRGQRPRAGSWRAVRCRRRRRRSSRVCTCGVNRRMRSENTRSTPGPTSSWAGSGSVPLSWAALRLVGSSISASGFPPVSRRSRSATSSASPSPACWASSDRTASGVQASKVQRLDAVSPERFGRLSLGPRTRWRHDPPRVVEPRTAARPPTRCPATAHHRRRTARAPARRPRSVPTASRRPTRNGSTDDPSSAPKATRKARACGVGSRASSANVGRNSP